MAAHLRLAHAADPAALLAAAALEAVFEWSTKEEAAYRGEE